MSEKFFELIRKLCKSLGRERDVVHEGELCAKVYNICCFSFFCLCLVVYMRKLPGNVMVSFGATRYRKMIRGAITAVRYRPFKNKGIFGGTFITSTERASISKWTRLPAGVYRKVIPYREYTDPSTAPMALVVCGRQKYKSTACSSLGTYSAMSRMYED